MNYPISLDLISFRFIYFKFIFKFHKLVFSLLLFSNSKIEIKNKKIFERKQRKIEANN
jgi:hypothetical protein